MSGLNIAILEVTSTALEKAMGVKRISFGENNGERSIRIDVDEKFQGEVASVPELVSSLAVTVATLLEEDENFNPSDETEFNFILTEVFHKLRKEMLRTKRVPNVLLGSMRYLLEQTHDWSFVNMATGQSLTLEDFKEA